MRTSTIIAALLAACTALRSAAAQARGAGAAAAVFVVPIASAAGAMLFVRHCRP